MKRRDLMKRLVQIAKAQSVEIRLTEGGNHTKIWIGDRHDVVPRHKEIDERLAQKIIRRMGGQL